MAKKGTFFLIFFVADGSPQSPRKGPTPTTSQSVPSSQSRPGESRRQCWMTLFSSQSLPTHEPNLPQDSNSLNGCGLIEPNYSCLYSTYGTVLYSSSSSSSSLDPNYLVSSLFQRFLHVSQLNYGVSQDTNRL